MGAKIVNYGSMNYDYTYQVDHMVRPGETLASRGRTVHCGGKGFNQSVALARAGVQVRHAGMLGTDGERFLEEMEKQGIDTCCVRRTGEVCGHAVIQVNPEGENCILLYEGSNGQNTEAQIRQVLDTMEAGDLLLLQNEINLTDRVIDLAWEKGIRIVWNPSPYNEKAASCHMEKVSVFLINETEGEQLTGRTEPDAILEEMERRCPGCEVVLTLGAEGVVWGCGGRRIQVPAYRVKAVDITAAGDTFTGYYLAAVLEGADRETALRRGCAASALAVQKEGAAASIPSREEVDRFFCS